MKLDSNGRLSSLMGRPLYAKSRVYDDCVEMDKVLSTIEALNKTAKGQQLGVEAALKPPRRFTIDWHVSQTRTGTVRTELQRGGQLLQTRSTVAERCKPC